MTIAQDIERLLNSGMDLDDQRELLVDQSYADGAYPGSSEWKEAKEYESALANFDIKHPEITAEITAEKEASKANYKLSWV